MAETTLPARVARTPENLSIQTAEELEDLWRTILPDFVKIVDPENSGFLDDLYSDQLLTHTDYESFVSGKDYMPRAQKARKLWFVLSSYNLDLFRAKVAPKLLTSFSLIIPDRFFSPTDQSLATFKTEEPCLRHAIQKRLRVETMADLLCHHVCLSHKNYGLIINDTFKTTTAKWNLVFDAFSGQTPVTQTGPLGAEVQELLIRYNVPIPDNMADVMSRGFPCTCHEPEASPPEDVQSRDIKVKSWLERKMAAVYQSSPDSSLTRVDVSSRSSTLRAVSEQDASAGLLVDDNSSISTESAATLTQSDEHNNKAHHRTHANLSPAAVNANTRLSEQDPEDAVAVTSMTHQSFAAETLRVGVTTGQQNEKAIMCPKNSKETQWELQTSARICSTDVDVTVIDMGIGTEHSVVERTADDDSFCDNLFGLINLSSGRLDSWIQSLTRWLGPSRLALVWLIIRIAVLFVVCSLPAVVRGRIVDAPNVMLEFVCGAVFLPPIAFLIFLEGVVLPVMCIFVMTKLTVKSALTVWKNMFLYNKKFH